MIPVAVVAVVLKVLLLSVVLRGATAEAEGWSVDRGSDSDVLGLREGVERCVQNGACARENVLSRGGPRRWLLLLL